MTNNESSSRIQWLLPKPLLAIALFLFLLLPAMGLAWFVFKFNISFLHAGDKGVVVAVGLCWWVCATLLIFGWRLRKPENEHGQ